MKRSDGIRSRSANILLTAQLFFAFSALYCMSQIMFVYLARNSTNQKQPSTNIGVYQPKEDEPPSNSSGSDEGKKDESLMNEGKKDESLMDSLRRKVKSLDPPPWPQLDSRTANAIANKGILVGPQETSNDATIGKFITH